MAWYTLTIPDNPHYSGASFDASVMGDRAAHDAAKAKGREAKAAYRNLPFAMRLAAGRVKVKVIKTDARPLFALDCTTYPNSEARLAALEKANDEDAKALNLAAPTGG